MKTNKEIATFSMILLFLMATIPAQSSKPNTPIHQRELQIRSPIFIDGNGNFTAENGVTRGLGTAEDPYIIEKWDINGTGTNGIEIQNTDAYFVIQNVNVHHADVGVELVDVIHGTIADSQISNNKEGISVFRGKNNTIVNNTISNERHGIHIRYDSDGNHVENNRVFGHRDSQGVGIFLEDRDRKVSSGNNIQANYVWNNSRGIWIFGTYNGGPIETTVRGNNVTGNYGYGIVGSGGGIWLSAYTSKNKIEENLVSGNDYGIHMEVKVMSNVITKNLVSNNWHDGIKLSSYSDYNRLSHNNISGNGGNGIVIYASEHNEVEGNFVINNEGSGISLYEFFGGMHGHNNLIYNNYFEGSNNVNNEELHNQWNVAKTEGTNIVGGPFIGGNYWSDYEERYPNAEEIDDTGIWDTPYVIDENNQDDYPLKKPMISADYPIPTIVSVDYSHSIEAGEWASIKITAKNDGGTAEWQTIHCGFPNNPPLGNIETVSHESITVNQIFPPGTDLPAKIYPPGTELPASYGEYNITSTYVMVEGVHGPWQKDEQHSLSAKVKPEKAGTFIFYVKTVSRAEGVTYYDATPETIDQQDEHVYVYEMSVQSDHIQLPVPYEAQYSAPWCGVASTAMVLRYYGKNVHMWDVGKVLTPAMIFDLVGIETYIHKTYPGEFRTKIGSYPSVSDQTRKDLEGNLSRGYPILLLTDPPGVGRHIVVVTGFNSSGFFINDPSGALFTELESSASFPYINEFATWQELQSVNYGEKVFLIVKGTPSPADATLSFVNTELATARVWGIRTIHDSHSKYGTYVDYDGWWWFLGLFWRHIGGHPTVLDPKDTLNYNFRIFNHKNNEGIFDFHLQIKGQDEVVHYEKITSDILVSGREHTLIGGGAETEIPLKDYLTEGQRYIITAEIRDSDSEEAIDSITLPSIYYTSRSIMFATECHVRILVTDPHGLRIGFDSSSNQTISEIQHALYYYCNGSGPELVSIPNQKVGNYSVKVFGIEGGTYNLTCTILDETGSLSVENLTNMSIEKNESQTHIFESLAPDISPPTISIVSPESKTYDENGVPLTFTVNESTSWIGYSLDGQANITISGNTTLTGLLGGKHSLVVYANDTAGNIGASETVYFTIDTPEHESFPMWTVAVMVIIAAFGTAIYLLRIKKRSNSRTTNVAVEL